MSFSDETRPIQSVPAEPEVEAVLPVREIRRRRRRGPRFWRHLRKRLRPGMRLGTFFVSVIAILIVLAIIAVALVSDANNRVQSSLASFNRVLTTMNSRPSTELTLDDFQRLQANADDLANTLASAKRQLFFLQPLAAYNADVKTTLTTLDAAQSLVRAAQDMLSGLQPTMFYLVSGERDDAVVTQISSGARVVELLEIGQSRFLSADDYLKAAQAQIGSIDLTAISPRVFLEVENLIGYHQQLIQINEVLKQAPDLLTEVLGLSGERSYLILSQNSDEIRPSGGYIGTFGWMTVRNGRITDYNYSPTTATSPNPPPEDFAAQVQVPDWWIHYNRPIYAAWDGSWYADFPSTAQMAMAYYNGGRNPESPVSGVIAIDIVGFETILGALGSVTVPGYDEPVATSNFREVVYDIRALGDSAHKRFLASLYQEIFTQWQEASYDPETSSMLLNALLRALQEKHVMLYIGDEELNRAVHLLGWSGAQTPTPGEDYLMVADANLGNKSNHSITRQLTYDVTIQADGTAQSRTTVTYDYSARRASTDPAVNPEFHGPLDYDNLMQLFVPPQSTLIETTNLTYEPEVVEGDSTDIIVSSVRVPYDSSERFQYAYNTGPVISRIGDYYRYRLLIQKQPGTMADAVSLHVTLPPQASIISISPEPSASYNLDQPILEFQFSLLSDRRIELIYAMN